MSTTFDYWGICNDCHFNGKLTFTWIEGEDYHDSEALGYLFEQSCPCCGVHDNTLIPLDEFHEMRQFLHLTPP